MAGIDTKKLELFEKRSIPSAILALSLPTIAGQLVSVVYSIADTLFVGMLGDPNQTATVTICFPAFLILNAITNLFGVGGASVVSRALGERQYGRARRVSAFSILLGSASGLLYAVCVGLLLRPVMGLLGITEGVRGYAADYLFWVVVVGALPSVFNVLMGQLIRAEGNTRQASFGIMLGGLCNVLLDPVFILPWGLGMGVAGAALATMLSNVLASLYFLCYYVKNRRHVFVSLSARGVIQALREGEYRRIFAVGIPAAIQNLAITLASMLTNRLTVQYGEVAVAAIGISRKIDMVPLYVAMGLAQGMMPLLGYSFAAGNYRRMHEAYRFTMKVSVLLSAISVAAIELWSPTLVGLFINDVQTVSYGALFLRITCVSTVFMPVNFLAVSTFQAAGYGRTALVLSVLRKGILEIGLLLLFNLSFGLSGIVWAHPVSEIAIAPVSYLLVRRLIERLEQPQTASILPQQ